jgi:hypothetical protein
LFLCALSGFIHIVYTFFSPHVWFANFRCHVVFLLLLTVQVSPLTPQILDSPILLQNLSLIRCEWFLFSLSLSFYILCLWHPHFLLLDSLISLCLDFEFYAL